MPSYEYGQSYGRWSDPPRRPSQWQKPIGKQSSAEEMLHSAEMQIERKIFSFQIRENSRGRILRITEHGNGKRNSIIIPATGLKDFQELVEEIAKAAQKIPSKGGNQSQA